MRLKLKKENRFLIILVAALLIVGLVGIYLTKKPITQIPEDTQTQKLGVQEKSDETSLIEKDLKDTDLSDLDKELEDIETELSGI